MWEAAALVVLVVVVALCIVWGRRRRGSRRISHLAELRAAGRLPDDVELALRRASRTRRTD